jgi:hypothetical protein
MDALILLPYPLGFLGLIDPWLEGGQPAIDAQYGAPLLSLVDWMVRSGLPSVSLEQPVDCHPTSAPPGLVAEDHDRLGAAGLLGLYASFGPTLSEAFIASAAIRGDSVVLFRSPPSSDAEQIAVAWRIRLEGESFAIGLVDAIESAQLGGAISENVVAENFGREVLIRNASDPAILTAWTNASDCGTLEDLPATSEETGMTAAFRRQSWGRAHVRPRITVAPVRASARGVPARR